MRKLYWGLAFLATLTAVGCVSSSGEVIGRSSQDKPMWVTGDIEEEPTDLILVPYRKAEVYRLELGLKQVQAEATSGSKQLLLERVRKDIGKQAVKTLGVEAGGYQSYLDQAVADAGKNLDRPDARIYRTYYEEVRRDSPNGEQIFYDIYVLVAIPASAYAETMDRSVKFLMSTNKEPLKKLGLEIRASIRIDSEG